MNNKLSATIEVVSFRIKIMSNDKSDLKTLAKELSDSYTAILQYSSLKDEQVMQQLVVLQLVYESERSKRTLSPDCRALEPTSKI